MTALCHTVHMSKTEPYSVQVADLDNVCVFSGDGAGAQARIDHKQRARVVASSLVYGVTSRPMPACINCAKAYAKDGFKVVASEGWTC